MHANAQTFTERVQQKQQGKGTVTIQQSKEIDDLVNDPTATGAQASTPKQPTGNPRPSTDNQKPVSHTQQPSSNTQQSTANNQQQTTDDQDSTTETPKPRATHKVTGYRVQAFAGGNSRKDRQTAEQIRNNIKSQFPNISVYVHFYSPRWICRVGNFRTYEEAHQMMVRLQNMGYKQATVVKGKITVAY
jgi:hypothetical protein